VYAISFVELMQSPTWSISFKI